jgi:hypothetical protein
MPCVPWNPGPRGRGSVLRVVEPTSVPRRPAAAIADDDAELSQPPDTGDVAVDAVVAALAAVVSEPLEDRLGVLERVHRTLQDRLADVEE